MTLKMSTEIGQAKLAEKVETIAEPAKKAPRRKRGKGETVAITVRLPREAWMTLHKFAMVEGEDLPVLSHKRVQ
jgi:hypothetical protein